MQFKNYCLICKKKKGFGTDHKKCSAELKNKKDGSDERRATKKGRSKKEIDDFCDYIAKEIV